MWPCGCHVEAGVRDEWVPPSPVLFSVEKEKQILYEDDNKRSKGSGATDLGAVGGVTGLG